MAQGVRGQTLIDAIVQVFQDAQGEQMLTADEVARRVRVAGFWGGKEPKASEQMVESYLTTRHAAMFDSGAGGKFALKSAFVRAGAVAKAPPAHSEPLELSPLAAEPSTDLHASGRPVPAGAPRVILGANKRKKRKSFGGATAARVTPSGAQHGAQMQRIDVHLSFEEALKLHLGLGELLGALNRRSNKGSSRRKPAAKIRIDLATHRVALFRKSL